MIEFSDWKNLTKEAQIANIDTMFELLDENKDSEYRIHKLLDGTDSSILQMYDARFVNFLNSNQDNSYLVTNIWNYLSKENQENNMQILFNFLDKNEDNQLLCSTIWGNTNREIQENYFNQVTENFQNNELTLNLFKVSKFKLSKEQFASFLKTYGNDDKNLENDYQTYEKIFSYNERVHSTIDFNIFNKQILNAFSAEQLARITSYPELEEKITNLIPISPINTLFNEIAQNDNWAIQLDSVTKNIDSYSELINNISQSEIDNDDLTKLKHILFSQKNYFQISNLDDVKDFYNIRNTTCKQILDGNSIENLSPELSSYSENELKQFAMLELMYGIDLEEAKNLVEKYGKDIEQINVEEFDKKTIMAITGMKRILECDNVQEKYNDNKNIINSELENIEYDSIVNLESSCIEMYSKMYDKTLYKYSNNDKVAQTTYQGDTIDVYEVSGDFNMFVRSEGACNGWVEPENFESVVNKPTTKHHGNCKSYIGQDFMGIASSKGPKFGYSNIDNSSLVLAAPWDIVSNGANVEFSIESTKWDLNCGIQFRTPQNAINTTRHSYNEYVFERLTTNENGDGFKRDQPQYIVYVVEPNIDRENDDSWRIARKAASQLKIPIILLDREKIAQRESEKISDLEDIFLGKKENTTNMSDSEILENLITKFENNFVGSHTSIPVWEKYFSNEKRGNIISNVWKQIKSYETSDFGKYCELLDKFVEISENEKSKMISNTGHEVSKSTAYSDEFIDALKSKQKLAKEQNSKNNIISLQEKYKKFTVKHADLISSKSALRNAKEIQKDDIEELRA